MIKRGFVNLFSIAAALALVGCGEGDSTKEVEASKVKNIVLLLREVRYLMQMLQMRMEA